MWGSGRVRAQVSLDLDFTASEETAERYEPRQEPRPVRSEQLLEETNPRLNPAGIPGALSNQPPGVATVPEIDGPESGVTTNQNPQNPQNPRPRRRARLRPARPRRTPVVTPTRKEVTRNYELDKRITHSRGVPGRIVRVSAAVVVDDRTALEAGQPVRKPLSPEEIERITTLVKQAVGFNAERGDSVNVLNTTFAPSPFEEPPLPMWQQAWFLELVKWGVVAVLSLAVLLLVVRPVLRRLLPLPAAEAKKDGAREITAPARSRGGRRRLAGRSGRISGALANGRPRALLDNPAEQLDKRMDLARSLVAEDPKRAVQVIRNWLTSEV